MRRFTILYDKRSAVMLLATALIAVLPLITSQAADPFRSVRAVVGGLAVLLFVGAVRNRPTTRHQLLALGIAGLLLAWLLVSAASAGLPSAVFGVHTRYQGLVSMALVVCAGAVGLQLSASVGSWLWAPLASVSVVQTASLLSQRAAGLDASGTFGNQVIAGSWLAVACAVLAAFVPSLNGRIKVVAGVAAALAALGVGLSGSRGALLAAAFGVAVALVPPALRGRRLSRAWLAVGLAVLMVGGLALAGGEVSSRYLPGALSSGSAASRWEIWRGTLGMIADKPWLGHGTGRFIYEFPSFQPPRYAVYEGGDVRPDQAHSQVLHLAAEGGIPAALLGIALAGSGLAGGLRGVREGRGLALVAIAGFVAYLVQGAFGVPAVELDMLGWLLGGAAISQAPSLQLRHSTVWLRAGAALLAVFAAFASTLYLTADLAHSRAITAFETGEFSRAQAESVAAVRAAGTVDTFRVAASDAALFMGPKDQAAALEVVESGLELEPSSYDLVLSRALLLEATGESDEAVAAAFLGAVRLWPQGIDVRLRAAEACRRAGDAEKANDLERGVRELLDAQAGSAVPALVTTP